MACYHSCAINAKIDDIWDTIKDFHDLSWAGAGIKSLEKIGEKTGLQVGAGRLLNGVFSETLLEVDPDDYMILYSIDDGPGVLSKETMDGYRGMIQLLPVTMGGGTYVEWSSLWRSDSEGVEDFCDPIYRAFLSALKEKMES